MMDPSIGPLSAVGPEVDKLAGVGYRLSAALMTAVLTRVKE